MNLKSSLLLIALISSTYILVLAQDSKSVAIKNFNGLTVSSGIDLYIIQGASESLTIKGRNDVIENVIVERNELEQFI